MLIYEDIISGDELFSDAYPITEREGIYEVDCAIIPVGGDNVDIGANPSAEGGDDEGADDSVQTVNNVIYSFRLSQTSFDKKSYMTYLKGYFKTLKAKLQENGKPAEEIADFEKKAQAAAKKIIANFKDYEFYTGESMDVEGMVALLNYREDGVTPFFTFFKDGVKETKV
ncbi:unnamed protein product [Cunninghamella echinulata]